MNPNPSEEEARAQNAALIEELREQLQKAETASEQYRKQLGVLQMRLDEAVSEQGKLEDLGQEKDSKMEALHGEIRDHVRQIRDLEQNREMERNAMFQEKEQNASREEEMQATIQRLKESLNQKDLRVADTDRGNLSRSCKFSYIDSSVLINAASFRNRSSPDVDSQFAPSSQLERSPSRNNSTILLQKDKLIESLRLELAESQIKQVEMENQGGGRQRELEKSLMETRMANARLMEDNESYQLLLSERTLNGDFTKGDFMREAHTEPKSKLGRVDSLADELESADAPEGDSPRRSDEVKSLKDQNRALTLYIERIISKVLQVEGFEHVLNQNENEPPKPTEKDLPPTPPEKDDAPQTFLQRAKSVVSGQATRPKPRPVSQMISNAHPSANENPDTAPAIPFQRNQSVRASHRRVRSEMTDLPAPGTFGPLSGRTSGTSGGPTSPTGPGSRQSASGASYFSGSGNRAPSVSSQPRSRLSSGASATSDPHGDAGSTGVTSSPPSSNGMNNYTGAVMTQKGMRPLRLATKADEEAARKKANRGSWMGWFKSEASQPNGQNS